MGDPATLKEKLKDPEHNNWFKAVLILRELKVGISSFVEDKCREAQKDVLRKVLNNLPPHVTAAPQCTTCTSVSLQRNRACPQNVCPFILQEISKIHMNRRIQLSCTDVSAWTDTSCCWEFAKTFIMGEGYGDKRSAADTDCAGLLSIIINCVWIHNSLTENMKRPRTVFHEVKNLRNDMMHSPDNRLSNALLQDLIKACVQILDDPKTLAADQTAIAARERIKEIEGMLLTVSNIDYPSVLLEVKQYLKHKISDISEKQASQDKDISDLAGKQALQDNNISAIAGKQASQEQVISDVVGKQASQDKDISNLAGKQASQEQDISDLAEKQASQDKDISDLAGKQALQDKDISDIVGQQATQDKDISFLTGKQVSQDKVILDLAGKQASQEEDISDLAGKQALQDKDISDFAGKQALQDKEISDIAGKQESQEDDISDLAGKQASQEEDIIDIARQQALQGNELRGRVDVLERDIEQLQTTQTESMDQLGAAELKADILKGYQKDFDTVLETSFVDGVSAIHMFSPIIIREDLENQLSDNSPVKQGTSTVAYPILHQYGKIKLIESYRDIFFKDGQFQRNIVLLGEAGVGKTTFCNHIVNLWCIVQADDCQRDLTGNDQALIGVLKQFEYLFVVRCRDTKEHTSVLSMIKEMFCSGEDEIHIDNIFRYKTKQCVVIIDGLDEWPYTSSVGRGRTSLHVLPDCTKIRGSTIIMTSRPWKVEALPRSSLLNCRVLQIEGLDREGIHNLTLKCIKALEPSVTDHETLCEHFLEQVKQQEMEDIVKQPLLLFSIIEYWLSRNHKLHRSLTMNYAGLINSVLSHSDNKLSDKDRKLAESQSKQSLPGCFTEMKICLTHSGIIRKISALAFKTLVLKEKEMSLVFSKKELIDEVGEDCLDLCLKLGILSETKVSSLARVKHVTISFIHKSVQECFAAVHLSEDKTGLCLTQFTNKLISLNEVFDFALILMFLFGMSPSTGQTVLNHVYGVVEHCSEIKAYRQCADLELVGLVPDIVRVCRKLFNQLYVRCAVESKHTVVSPNSQHISSESNLYIPDVLIDERTPDDVMHLLFCPGEHVKSVTYMDYRITPFHVVESLSCMTNVEKLVVVLSNDHVYKHIKLIIQSIPYLQQLQSFRLDFSLTQYRLFRSIPLDDNDISTLSVLPSTLLFTELGKLTNLISVALSCLRLETGDEKMEFPKNLNSVCLFNMIVSSDIFACLPSSCTTVHLDDLILYGDLVFPSACTFTTLCCRKVSCKGDLVFPSTCNILYCNDVSFTGDLVFPSSCNGLYCRDVSFTGDLVFPSTCNTLDCSKISCKGDLVFPSTCTTLDCSKISCKGDLVFPSTCTTLNCSGISCKGDLMFTSTCSTLSCSDASYTGDLVFPSTCTTLHCSSVSCTGKLVFPLVCTKLNLEAMALRDLSVLPDKLTSLDIYNVTLTQSSEEQLCRSLQSTPTLQRLSVCGMLHDELYLHGHLDLSSCLSLHTLKLDYIVLDGGGVVVPENLRDIRMSYVTLSEEHWDQLVHNIYTCYNVRVYLFYVTFNEATLKYIRQHFIVTSDSEIPDESELFDLMIEEEMNGMTDEMNDNSDVNNDRTDEMNDRTDEKNDKSDVQSDTTDEKNDITDSKNDKTDEKTDTKTENNDRTDETNDRTDDKNDITDDENGRPDKKENDRKDEENVYTVRRLLEFHTRCPENE